MADQQRLEDFLEQKEYCFDALLVEFRWLEELEDVMQDSTWHREGNVPVSYTHLTLPTNSLV